MTSSPTTSIEEVKVVCPQDAAPKERHASIPVIDRATYPSQSPTKQRQPQSIGRKTESERSFGQYQPQAQSKQQIYQGYQTSEHGEENASWGFKSPQMSADRFKEQDDEQAELIATLQAQLRQAHRQLDLTQSMHDRQLSHQKDLVTNLKAENRRLNHHNEKLSARVNRLESEISSLNYSSEAEAKKTKVPDASSPKKHARRPPIDPTAFEDEEETKKAPAVVDKKDSQNGSNKSAKGQKPAQQKKKPRKPKKKKNISSSDDDDMQFLDSIIAKNKQIDQEQVDIDSDLVLRCTYCQPTLGFEDLAQLRDHMTNVHKTEFVFMEASQEVQQKTLKFHADFYANTGIYQNEVAYKLCKCKNLPLRTTRAQLYLHSIEASHYPLIACQSCGILMEREDIDEHNQAACNPVREGAIFLSVVNKKIKDSEENQVSNKAAADKNKPIKAPAATVVELPDF